MVIVDEGIGEDAKVAVKKGFQSEGDERERGKDRGCQDEGKSRRRPPTGAGWRLEKAGILGHAKVIAKPRIQIQPFLGASRKKLSILFASKKFFIRLRPTLT